MKAYSNAYNTYKNNSVNYASKEQLLLMLLDGAVKYAKIGRQAIVDDDIQKKHDNLIRTQDIFYELMISLDRNAGGEWGDNLYAVYEFINQRLMEANMKKDVKIMDEIIPLIEEVRDLWNEAYKLSVKK
ncbi:flagellar protein FliS [Clostridium argentinense CDC 2741]|uniref:Flagellar secretion chaperone FliS n=1 Tax=Clostridium argentinense CDC 2741 TaxID=1418104 RepID=A0A0C1UIA3_9CLOT|nr:flagellar export chaperone FliS [Clostridium argentinense]ARC85332.1 flagellar protein FliS [Clostridium argentinense]KIE47075.1 flagellar protein FliS [Clostridium argentinense CDC 2741]NFF41501.1 flagellar export chaperone FliS [Clostridium argentinense]NFP52063.1 flagellar export chaperone FliS [Clostridium argentinense]NFP73529.1 flagellar export chaperone FliS [Clostridium argentinense]